MSEEVAIRVEHVSKDFILPHEKVTTVKSLFSGIHKRRPKSREVQHALKDISLEIKRGEFFGIVGRNGSGKSTLLKILAGIYQPTKGRVASHGKLVPFIELGVGFNPELTGRENVYLNGAMLGFSTRQVDSMYDDIVRFAELERFMDQKLKNYSSGMQVRLAFSMATRAEADILLVDEVLAVGDAAFQRKCFEYFKELKAKHKTVVFVTHDMNAVREYCDRAALIDGSELQHMGDPQDIAREYALLFMDEATERRQGKSSRWGAGDASFTEVTAKVDKQDVIVRATVHVERPVDKLIYGLHIVGPDGKEITAMNNRMIQMPDIEHLTPGMVIVFEWHILNIFNDAMYDVTLTLVDSSSKTLDWYIGAASFTVKRIERSTTAVMPPVSVAHKVITSDHKRKDT
jgi:ABC-2 type transport system ATP-binding protein